MGKRDAVIVAYGRSPMGKANKGFFSKIHPIDFASQTLKGVLNKLSGLDCKLIDDVVVGVAMPENYLGYNVAKLIVQAAKLPVEVSAMTINRFCSSGLQSIEIAANSIKSGSMDIVVAGGVELMTGLSMTLDDKYKYEPLEEFDKGAYMPMGFTAENVAEKFNISRQEMDEFAVESHRKALRAQMSGYFDREIIPIETLVDGEKVFIKSDEGVRSDISIDKLSSLKPAFREDGLVTAATSSQMTDGAGFVVLMSREKAEELGYKPIANFLGFSVAGVPADIMGIGPVAAVPKVLNMTGLSLEQMDVIEMNEAFASQAIYCINKLKMDKSKVNPNGGAIALGHPLGATGTILVCKVLSQLERINGDYGMVTMCIGGGMGAAGVLNMEK
ncbi:thiolase family protein [Peptoniphilaceae bacterium SGI.131]